MFLFSVHFNTKSKDVLNKIGKIYIYMFTLVIFEIQVSFT